jgi:hypothetical protein
MGKDKRDILILCLILVIVILLGLTAYILLIKPALNGLIIKGYNQGQVDTVNAIISQVSNSGYVELYAGDNQSLILVPYQSQQV